MGNAMKIQISIITLKLSIDRELFFRGKCTLREIKEISVKQLIFIALNITPL